jgi:pSer/pThr/pTyr-binding forkhead associated (FHA) protein
MFALEIIFHDGVSQPEMIYVRRPQALIGASDVAHVEVEDLRELNCQIRLVRELGRRFRCLPSGNVPPELAELPAHLFDGQAAVDLGPVKFFVTALDSDLGLRETEPPDRAGVRILRQACAAPSPVFPAVVVRSSTPMVVSFVADQPIYIGRSRQCALRLDSADISGKHARLGYENGQFWVEDLGSTNGTFVNEQQISGRVNVAPGVPIILGREISIVGVTSEDQITQVSLEQPAPAERAPAIERTYPVLVSISEVARPAKLVLAPGHTVNLGRDPSSDIWLGAPHVSRRHCSVLLRDDESVVVTDHSTNGTGYDGGVLKRGQSLEFRGKPCVLDFGSGVTVALCFGEEQETDFVHAQGSTNSFSNVVESRALAASGSDLSHSTVDAELPPQVGAKRRGWLTILFDFYRGAHGWQRALLVATVLAVVSALVIIGFFLVGVTHPR